MQILIVMVHSPLFSFSSGTRDESGKRIIFFFVQGPGLSLAGATLSEWTRSWLSLQGGSFSPNYFSLCQCFFMEFVL